MKKGILLLSIIILILFLSVFIYFFCNRYSLTQAFLIKPLNRFETKEKIVALTFDDGPHARWTPLLLDLLKKYSVRATFFVVGEKVEKTEK